MAINSILSVGVQGVQAGMQRANRAAGEIASAGAGLGTTNQGDLATPIVDLKLSELQVKASAAVIKTADEVVGTLIDIKA